MTWNEVLTVELRRLRAQEELSVGVFEALFEQAHGGRARAVLREMVDEAPSRMARLELILAHLDGAGEGLPLRSFEGWRADARDLAQGDARGEAHDAAVLGLLLRSLRSRTACYEVAYVVARNMGVLRVSSLLGALLRGDQETDARVAEALAAAIVEGEGRWELGELRR